MPIENRHLEPGTKLIAKYRKETYHAVVVTGEGGKVLYQLPDGKEYKSTSALGTAITGKSCNGWAFWSVDAGEPTELEAAPEQPTEEETTGEPTEQEPEPPISLGFRRVPNQKGVDPGQVRLYCNSCHNSFIVPQSKNPTECPMAKQILPSFSQAMS